MIKLYLGYLHQEITVSTYDREIDHGEFEKTIEIIFKDGRKKVCLKLDRKEVNELIGLLKVARDLE